MGRLLYPVMTKISTLFAIIEFPNISFFKLKLFESDNRQLSFKMAFGRLHPVVTKSQNF